MPDKPPPGLMDRIGSTLSNLYADHMAKSIGYDRADPASLEKARAELMALQRANDPNGASYGMQGKTVAQILQESERVKALQRILEGAAVPPLPPQPMGGGGPATRITGAAARETIDANMTKAGLQKMGGLGNLEAQQDERIRRAGRVRYGDGK